MRLLITILFFEGRRFLRQPAMWGSCIVFLLTGLGAIRSGNEIVKMQKVQTDSIRLAYQYDFNKAIAAFSDTSTPDKKRLAPYAGMAEMVNNRLPQPAVWPSRPLMALSLGQSDIQPYYMQVKVVTDFLSRPPVPVSNPFKLFAGNFDLAFVLIYLLPLLIIVLSYPVFAEEKESGTLSLLSVQGVKLRHIIVYKLLFRLLAVTVMTLLMNIAGFMIIMKQVPLSYTEAIQWCFVTLVYVVFWFSLVYALVALRLSSATTALSLAGAWLLVLIVLPAFANLYVSLKYPVSLREDVSSFYRKMSEEVWETNPRTIVDSFNQNNPRFNYLANPAKDTLPMSRRFFAGYYDLLERRMVREATSREQERSERQYAFERLTLWNPALSVQQLFNTLAGTNMAGYGQFRQQAGVFQLKWQTYIYNFQLPVKYLQPADFYHFPVFTPVRTVAKMRTVLIMCLVPLVLTVLLGVFGWYQFSSKP